MISPKKIYKKMPKIIQFPIDYIYGSIPNNLKYGAIYRETKNLLSKSEWWTEEQHILFQERKMKDLLIHAYEHVPYYKNIFNEYGFNPYSFKHLNEIEVLPLLNKSIIQERLPELIADNISPRKIIKRSTGGTSGNQLSFYDEKNTESKEWPFVESIWGRVGYNAKSRVAALRNDSIKGSKPYMHSWKQRRLILDNFHTNDKNIKAMLDKLCEDKIEYIHTYPSAILSLCEYIRRTEYQMTYAPKAVLATSENIYPGQKELVERTLNCRLFTFYGHTERSCIAGWCEHSDLYHINSEYGYTELIDENNRIITDASIEGEIVCTGFNNMAMPFIRYQTGDYSSYAYNDCPCGRNYKLLNSIEGRWLQEMIVCKDESKVSITALNMHSDIFKNVKQYQLYQDTVGVCIMNIVKADLYSDKDESAIKREFLLKIGDLVDLKINYVKDIEKTKAGKYKYLIQKLPM